MKIRLENKKGIGPILSFKFKKRKINFCACHQEKDKSIWFFGIEKYFCSRCIGLILGAIVGVLFKTFFFRLPLYISLILATPLIIDSLTQLFDLRKSNNILRLTTGILFGFGLMAF